MMKVKVEDTEDVDSLKEKKSSPSAPQRLNKLQELGSDGVGGVGYRVGLLVSLGAGQIEVSDDVVGRTRRRGWEILFALSGESRF